MLVWMILFEVQTVSVECFESHRNKLRQWSTIEAIVKIRPEKIQA